MRVKWVVALGAALAGIAACASFGTSGGDATTTTSPEAGSDSSNADRETSDSDSSVPDAPHFCDDAGSALFCDDFEGDSGASVLIDDAGEGGVTIGPGVDAGQDLAAFVPIGSGDVGGDVAFEMVTIPGVGDVRVEADVYFEPVSNFEENGAGASVNILEVQFGSDDGPRAFAQVGNSPLQQGAFAYDSYDSVSQGTAVLAEPPVPQTRWVHVVLEAGLIQNETNDSAFVRVSWNGWTAIEAVHSDGAALARSLPPTDNVTVVFFGAARYAFNTIESPFTVHVDNVVVTAMPAAP